MSWPFSISKEESGEKDEKLLFEYVGQSEASRTAFRQWEKGMDCFGITDSNTTKEWETLQRKIRTQEAIIPMLGISKNEIFRLAESGCCCSHRTSDCRRNPRCPATLFLIATGKRTFVCETPYGEKSKVVLSDGTVVWLNAGSTLKYSNKFNTDNRRVELNGEGYFEVTKKRGSYFHRADTWI